MPSHICIPHEDLAEHIESGVNEAVKDIVRRVREHVESAHDSDGVELSLEDVTEAIQAEGWSIDDLGLELDENHVREYIENNSMSIEEAFPSATAEELGDTARSMGFSASDMGFDGIDDADELVQTFGTSDTLAALYKAESANVRLVNGQVETSGKLVVFECVWRSLSEEQRQAFMAQTRKDIEAEIRETIAKEVTSRIVSQLLGK